MQIACVCVGVGGNCIMSGCTILAVEFNGEFILSQLNSIKANLTKLPNLKEAFSRGRHVPSAL